MRCRLIVIVILLLLVFIYNLLDLYSLDTGYRPQVDVDGTAATRKSDEIDVKFDYNRLFSPSTYDVDMVKWTLSCTRSPAYLADLAYTLKQITDVLEEFEITYILDSATLIGGLRMNGPLPYDDDIDITVLEEDFKPKKHLFYDAMKKRNVRVRPHDDEATKLDQFFHINQSSSHGMRRPYIDIFMVKESKKGSSYNNQRTFEFVIAEFKNIAACPFKKSTIFGQEQQTSSLSTPIPTTTVSTPRGPQVVTNRALEAAWYHYKAQQRRTRAVLRPGLQKILHHRYGMLSTVMFLGRLYPAAADPFAYADCQNGYYMNWHNRYLLSRQHPVPTEPEMCRTARFWANMAPSPYSYVSADHKRGAAISAYIMLERLKKTMCYQAKQSADIMLQGTIVNKYNNSIVTIEEEYNATDTMLFRQMCSMEGSLCNVTFTC